MLGNIPKGHDPRQFLIAIQNEQACLLLHKLHSFRR
jgi:hypothetical protein